MATFLLTATLRAASLKPVRTELCPPKASYTMPRSSPLLPPQLLGGYIRHMRTSHSNTLTLSPARRRQPRPVGLKDTSSNCCDLRSHARRTYGMPLDNSAAR